MPPQSRSRDSRSKPELLSPAGNRDCLETAVRNGADAVYLGTREFNARVYARNFSFPELKQAADYCHRAGVRVYLALNTLVKNSELRRYFDVLSRAYALGVDGVIIQHLSFLPLIKDSFPGLAVFISTQAAIGNLGAASLCKAADRIILPRELALREIRNMTKSGIKTEVFVHGALCFSYSGLCLFSSFVGSRSGNRGSCAQLCRQTYNGAYPLSTKELCLVGRIPELISAGVTGFKIEGRMRSPLYVAVATRLYRKAIDSFLAGDFAVPEKEMEEIEVVFNREFTEGFIGGGMGLTSPEKPMNRGAFLGELEGNELVVRRAVAVGDGVGVWSEGQVGGGVIEQLSTGGRKVNSAAAGDRVNLGIRAADGARVYLTSSPRISLDPGFVVKRPPVAIPARKKARIALPAVTPRRAPPLELLVRAYSVQEAREASRAGAGTVFYDIFSPDFPGHDDWREQARLGAYLPRIMDDAGLSAAVRLLRDRMPGAVLAGNLGFLPQRAEFKVPVYVDYSLNAFNDLDLLFFRRFRVTPLISPELSLQEMAELTDKDVAVFCHGDIVLVNTRIDPGTRELVDARGAVFPVRQEGGYWQILNSRPFGVFDDIHKLLAAGFTRFYIDRQGESARFTSLYRRILSDGAAARRLRRGHTSGHLYRPVS